MGSIVPFVTQTTWKQSTKATAFLPLRLPKYSGLKESSVRGVSERMVPQGALGLCCTPACPSGCLYMMADVLKLCWNTHHTFFNDGMNFMGPYFPGSRQSLLCRQSYFLHSWLPSAFGAALFWGSGLTVSSLSRLFGILGQHSGRLLRPELIYWFITIKNSIFSGILLLALMLSFWILKSLLQNVFLVLAFKKFAANLPLAC